MTAAEGFVDELLLMARVPATDPAVVGSNSTLNVAVWLGLSVSGNVAPEKENPVPEMDDELTVTGAVPDEVSVSDWVAGEFRFTSPNAMLVALMVSAGTAALSCRANVSETLFALAVSVAD